MGWRRDAWAEVGVSRQRWRLGGGAARPQRPCDAPAAHPVPAPSKDEGAGLLLLRHSLALIAMRALLFLRRRGGSARGSEFAPPLRRPQAAITHPARLSHGLPLPSTRSQRRGDEAGRGRRLVHLRQGCRAEHQADHHCPDTCFMCAPRGSSFIALAATVCQALLPNQACPAQSPLNQRRHGWRCTPAVHGSAPGPS